MKITDKMRMDFLEENHLIAFVIFGRLGSGREPVTGYRTARESVDALLRTKAMREIRKEAKNG